MNIKAIFLLLISSLCTAAVAQEHDDMYFNRKDRAKLKSQRAEKPAQEREDIAYLEEEDVNPTDSYSARNVNPEYTSRSTSETAQHDNEDYFVNNYSYQNRQQLNSWNNNFNTWYNSPWYSSAYWGTSLNSWNTPYYAGNYYNYYGSGFYDPWASPWNNPYNYRSRWSASFSYGWGSGFYNNYYGWGSGFGNSWYDPWDYYYSPMYSSWYSPYSYGGWYGYPSRVIVVEREPNAVYGKRGSRSSGLVSDANRRTERAYTNSGSGSRSDNSGRISTRSTRQSDYYERTWRSEPTRQSTDNSNTGRMSTWDNNNNSRSSSTPSWRSTTPSQSQDRSPSRSSSSGSSGSSGSRSSRGRGN